MSKKVYLGLGSNLGDREQNLRRALAVLDKTQGITVRSASSFYETEPVGPVTGQDDFYNAAVEIETTLSSQELLTLVKAAEIQLGRVSGERWGPRVIDIDILLWNNDILQEEGLTVPHPEMTARAFVLTPLAELAPDVVHPVARKSVAELASQLDDAHRVRRLDVKLQIEGRG